MSGSAIPDIVINTPLWLALVTTGVGALEGAIIGRSSKDGARPDVVGLTVFALFLGLGGGMVRDTMLGNLPFESLRTPWYLVVVVASVVVVLVAGRLVPVNSTIFIVLDAMTTGLYAAIGAQYALDFGLPWVGAIFVGMFAGLSGGVIVALLRRETPALLYPGSPYGLLALLGVLVYLPLSQVNGVVASFSAVGVVVVGRLAVRKWGISTRAVKPIPPTN